jgi:hypothetical protein
MLAAGAALPVPLPLPAAPAPIAPAPAWPPPRAAPPLDDGLPESTIRPEYRNSGRPLI